MIDIEEYINSGILELYVAGTLNREDSYEVYANIQKYPELKEYVNNIEQTVINIAELSTGNNVQIRPFENLMSLINKRPRKLAVINWYQHIGWAACILLTFGIINIYLNKNQLKNSLTKQIAANEVLDHQRATLQSDLIDKKFQLNRQNDVIAFIALEKTEKINLAGQKIAPNSFANIYWNQEKNEMYVDLEGLPPAPEGKVYQLWSLTLNPLSPTSLGTLDDYNNGKRFVKVGNQNKSEAFGITLEPKGGSKSPTLEQLYTLGLTKNS
ncbi:anti-sigma factor [Wenyingzhuangia sp. IMCC45533]